MADSLATISNPVARRPHGAHQPQPRDDAGDQQDVDRAELRPVPAAPHHAAEEPEPARAARFQPVHQQLVSSPRSTADQHEPAAHHPGGDAEGDQANTAMNFLGATATVDGSATKLKNGSATWSFSVDKPSTATVNIKSSTGALAYTGTFPLSPGPQSIPVGRPRQQHHAVAGRRLYALGHRQGRERQHGRGRDRGARHGR